MLLVGDWLQLPPVSTAPFFLNPGWKPVAGRGGPADGPDRSTWGTAGPAIRLALLEGFRCWCAINHMPCRNLSLGRLRTGQATHEDVDYLNATCTRPPELLHRDTLCPLMATSSETRVECNRAATYAYALQTGRLVYRLSAHTGAGHVTKGAAAAPRPSLCHYPMQELGPRLGRLHGGATML